MVREVYFNMVARLLMQSHVMGDSHDMYHHRVREVTDFENLSPSKGSGLDSHRLAGQLVANRFRHIVHGCFVQCPLAARPRGDRFRKSVTDQMPRPIGL